jgi:hypothetical protein
MSSRFKVIVAQDRAQRAATGTRNRAQEPAWRSLPGSPTRAALTNQQLATAAREHAATQASGSLERRAWGCLAVALSTTGTVRSALGVLNLAPAEIRDVAQNLLDQLT